MNPPLPPRVDYDRIAHLYDSQPYRDKQPDPELAAFLERRLETDSCAVLDLGCGTGNQLAANYGMYPRFQYVGMDRFRGMLRQARPKSNGILWVQADSAWPPFRSDRFDFISCQYMFHHVQAKQAMLDEVFRLLRRGGRFVMTNIDPHEASDGLLYRFFPAAWEADMNDFWRQSAISATLYEAGFSAVEISPTHYRFEQNMEEFLASVRRRDTCSQLLTIPDSAYRAGLDRLEAWTRDPGSPQVETNHLCLITVHADWL